MESDWRALYAANQAAIAQAGVPSSKGLRLEPLDRWEGAPSGVGQVSTVGQSSPRALVHIPRGLDDAKPAPLVCMLHGCTQDPGAFAAATLMNDTADRHQFVVVYPGQARSNNPQGCWNWFLPEHQQRDSGEPAMIAAIVADLVDTNAKCAIDPERLFVAGLSSGAAMAAILGACYPDLFAAVAVHSGLAYRSATNIGTAFEAMAHGATADSQGHAARAAMGRNARVVPTIVIHGTADQTVAPANAIQVLRQSMAANHLAAPERCDHNPGHPTSSRQRQTDRGHHYTQSQWRDTGGRLTHELLMIDGLGHAWSGGAAGASHTDPRGPSATEAVWEFFGQATDASPLATDASR